METGVRGFLPTHAHSCHASFTKAGAADVPSPEEAHPASNSASSCQPPEY